MPFVNQKQRQACWSQWNKAKKEGKKPKWNCKKWDNESYHFCNSKCKDGYSCQRKCKTKKCWQHTT
jgi:hypothetical protein